MNRSERFNYSNGADLRGGGIEARANLVSDEWGPCPFIMMTGENFTPNDPDGEHHDELADAVVGVGGSFGRDDRLHLGVIGKDGVYCTSSD